MFFFSLLLCRFCFAQRLDDILCKIPLTIQATFMQQSEQPALEPNLPQFGNVLCPVQLIFLFLSPERIFHHLMRRVMKKQKNLKMKPGLPERLVKF